MEHWRFEDVCPIENYIFPASYVSLPEGSVNRKSMLNTWASIFMVVIGFFQVIGL